MISGLGACVGVIELVTEVDEVGVVVSATGTDGVGRGDTICLIEHALTRVVVRKRRSIAG
jgi:hypothetical protein